MPESGVDFSSEKETEQEQMIFLCFSFILLLSNPHHTHCVSDTVHFAFEVAFHTGT